MKTTKLIFIALLLHYVIAKPVLYATELAVLKKPNPTTATSEIKNVTVYLSGAEVKRHASITLKPGINSFLFNQLSSDIDENSIQISGLENATILSINYGVNYLSKLVNSEKVDSLKGRIKKIQTQVKQLKNKIEGLKKEEEILSNNQQLGSNVQEINLEKVKELAKYYRERIVEIRNAILNEQLKNDAFIIEQNALQNQLNEFNISEEVQSGEILLKINSDQQKGLQLELQYTVKNAGWFPIYDVKATTIDNPLSFAYKAHVYQNTGVSWNNVSLELSIDDPNTNTNKPNIIPKYLNFVNPYTYKKNQNKISNYNYKYNPTIKKINGIVLDESGIPLPGANVIVKGTSQGVQTDFDGKYNLEIYEGEELEVSYVGYTTKTIPIHASTMNISLDFDQNLDEVIVTASGIKREKKALGFAVSALENRAPGIQINGNSGSGSNVIIRGFSSITGKNQPLYVVDGIPFESGIEGNPFLNINPDEILETNILKGVSATTLYGQAGRNGVVFITTKSGKVTSEGIVLEEGITNTRFKIEQQHTILSEEDVTVIKIDQFEVPVLYEYLAIPVINENTFLTAKIKQWEEYNLLPGEANIYFEGSYTGKTFINPQAITDELTISLGIDPNVTIERKEKDNFKSKSFIGNSRILDKAYTITVKNNKKTPISLTLLDRIPVSQNKEIKVNNIQTYDAEYTEETGELKWALQLNAGDSIEKSLNYQLRFPKHKSISL